VQRKTLLFCEYKWGGIQNMDIGALPVEVDEKKQTVLDDNYSSYPEIRKSRTFLTIQALTTVRVINEENNFPRKACFVYGLHTRISKPVGPVYALNASSPPRPLGSAENPLEFVAPVFGLFQEFVPVSFNFPPAGSSPPR